MGGMMVSPEPLAVQEGVRVLKKGGNVVDAAVTAALVAGVAAPEMCGIGGEGTMQIFLNSKGEHKLLDFLCRAGSKANPAMWEEEAFHMVPHGVFVVKGMRNVIGYESVCVPGEVLGLYEAVERYGTMSWKEACKPAIEHARNGCLVDQRTYRYFTRASPYQGYPSGMDRLRATKTCMETYLKEDGSPYQAGELLVNKDYSRKLGEIARKGPHAFYEGEIAHAICGDFEENGGFIVEADLKRYKVSFYNPVETDYRGFVVSSNRPPGCGITLLEMLKILEGYEMGKMDRNGLEYLHILAQAMKRAHVDRAEVVGDQEFTEVPVKKLISAEYASGFRNRSREDNEPWKPRFPLHRALGSNTTHLSVMDDKGNAVSLTHTLGSGSGVITKGLGFEFNNEMAWFHPLPGTPNSISPGKAPVVGLTPTMIFKDGTPFMVLGSPGGWNIPMSVLQVILNFLEHKSSIEEAVSWPRIYCSGDLLMIEETFPDEVFLGLKKKGYTLEKYSRNQGILAQAIVYQDGKLRGGTDPGGNGIVGFC